MKFRFLGAAMLAVTSFGVSSAYAQLNTTLQTGSVSGINGGFGNVIGSNATLTLNQADSASNLVSLSLVRGGGTLSNTGVIYFDSLVGGFTDTTTLNDNADGGRAAISARGINDGGGRADITFASGFDADYALAFGDFGAALFDLNAGGANSLTFINFQEDNPANEFNYSLDITNLGIVRGQSFDYVVTYLNQFDGNNQVNAFRSNEFIGVAPGNFPDNIGVAAVTLPANSFNRFVSVAPAVVPEAGTLPLALSALSVLGAVVVARRRNAK